MKKTIIFYFALVLCFFSAQAQHYSLLSQYMYNGLVINPAYAGSNRLTDITFSHREQWTGLTQSPSTSVVSLNSPLTNEKLNLGFVFMDDRVGPTSNQLINGIYAYRLKFGSYKLSFGVQAGLQFSRTNWDDLLRNDQNDELLQNVSPRTIGITSGAGFYLHNDFSFVSGSLPYLVNTNGYQKVGYGPMLLNAGFKFALKDSSSLKPSFLVRSIKGSPVQFDLNLMYNWKKRFGVGASYRNRESIVAMLEVQLQKQFLLVYSYDAGIGALKKYNNGSHEVMLRYLITKTPEKEVEKENTSEIPSGDQNQNQRKEEKK